MITDVHANVPALQTVLGDIQKQGYDLLVHCGDVIGIGPQPAECLDMLLNLPNARFIKGNHDAYFAHGFPDPPPDYVLNGHTAHHEWTFAQLDPACRDVLAHWEREIHLDLDGLRVTFLHYPLRADGQDFVPVVWEPTAEKLDTLFADYDADLIFYGHHHPIADHQGRARYINSGAVGCQPQAVAPYVILSIEKGRFSIEKFSLDYDDSVVFELLERSKVPSRETIRDICFKGRGVPFSGND